jgi:hypothetical protein
MNIHAHHTGRRVEVVTPQGNVLAADFPGWGADNYADFLVPMEAGLTGTITNVESHGMNPWTRYTVAFDNGTRTFGLDPATIRFI